MGQRLFDNIETNDMNFKHLETTKDIVISPKNEYGEPQLLDATHTWSAKVSNGTSYVGDYAVKINGTSLIVDSSDFTKLPVGSYQLEIWEQWTGTDGTSELSIYPSPRRTIPFNIYANVADQDEKEIKRIGFQDVVDQAVMNIGMNYVFKVNTIEPDQNATVVQSAADGKNYVTFNIPRGQTGEQGFRGPAGKNFHIQQTFASVKDMEASQGKGFEDGDFALIASDVNDPDNSKFYVWSDANKKFTYMDDLSGAQGIQGPVGPAPTLHVTKVTTVPNGEQPSFTATSVGNGNYNIEIGLPKGNNGDTPKRGVDYWTDADKQAIKDDVTKTVGDAFAKAKADVDDLILSGLNNYFVAKMPVMNDGKNHVSVSHGQAQRFNNQGGFTGELVHPDGTDITVNALKGDVITQSFVLKTDANYNNLTFNFQTVDGDQVITAGAKQLAVNTYKMYASYTATRDTPVKIMTFWADCKGGTYVELSQPYATIM